ncbi:MAG: exonuclease/endonuclease/phosphatase family protein [Planctomycetota bacterium]|jgi:hypothetical protein
MSAKIRSPVKKWGLLVLAFLIILSCERMVEAANGFYWEGRLGTYVYLEPGDYIAYVDASVYIPVEQTWPNRTLGSLRLMFRPEGSEEKEIWRGLFGTDDVAQRIYFEFEVRGTKGESLTVISHDLAPEVHIVNDQFVVKEMDVSSASEFKAATWNIFYEDEDMNGIECCPAAEAMGSNIQGPSTGPGILNDAWDVDVIFWQEVDRGNIISTNPPIRWPEHQIVNHIYNALNKEGHGIPAEEYPEYNIPGQHHKTGYRWTASWSRGDRYTLGWPIHIVDKLNSFLLTTVRDSVWFNPDGVDEWSKGYFTDDVLEACGCKGNKRLDHAHGQPRSECFLGAVPESEHGVGTYYNWMNVCKAKLPNGQVIFLADVHLVHAADHAEGRQEQIFNAMGYLRKLADADGSYDGRVLMGGDFNFHGYDEEWLLELAREEFGFAIDASMAVGMDDEPTKLDDGCVLGSNRYDTFYLLGEGWRTTHILDYHINDHINGKSREFEIYDETGEVKGNCVPDDDPRYYNRGLPIADADHLPVRITLRVYDRDLPLDAIWVDFAYTGDVEKGTLRQPFKTLENAVTVASSGETICIKRGTSDETITITKELTLRAPGGTLTIGEL